MSDDFDDDEDGPDDLVGYLEVLDAANATLQEFVDRYGAEFAPELIKALADLNSHVRYLLALARVKRP